METGVKIAWNAEDISQEQKLMEKLEENAVGCLGYGVYVKARGKK